MSNLELKIPPVILVVIFLAIMWLVSFYLKITLLSQSLTFITALIIFLIGLVIALSGVFSFKQSDTTVNPTTPQETSSLVTSGVYKFTRNPMYVGFLFFLISWAVYLSSLASFITPVFFVLYINKFQIRPEEKMLSSIFGNEFYQYTKKVRRWL